MQYRATAGDLAARPTDDLHPSGLTRLFLWLALDDSEFRTSNFFSLPPALIPHALATARDLQPGKAAGRSHPAVLLRLRIFIHG
jgi:hypothetical protein